MREDRRDHIAPERRGGNHQSSVLGPRTVAAVSAGRRRGSPRRRWPSRRACEAARSAGSARRPAAATRSVRRAPFTRSDERRRLGDAEPRRRLRHDLDGAARSRRRASGSSTRAVPRPSTASTETVYVPSAALPRRFEPSHVATCSPAPTGAEKGVATHLPSRRMRTESVAGTVSGTAIETVSPLPSPLGVSAGAESTTRPSSAGDHDGDVHGRRAPARRLCRDADDVGAVRQRAAVERQGALPGAPPAARLELRHGGAGRVDHRDGDVRVDGERERDRRRVRLPVARSARSWPATPSRP